MAGFWGFGGRRAKSHPRKGLLYGKPRVVYPARASTVWSMKYTKVQYHPNGYPHLGLVPRSIKIHYRDGMSVHTLKKRLEKWERANGNPEFQARKLTKLPAPLAYELVQVYISMRERFPNTKPDYVNFCADLEYNELGETFTYIDNMPVMQSLLCDGIIDGTEHYGTDEMADIVKDYGGSKGDIKAVKNETLFYKQEAVLNPLAVGVISIGSVYSKKRAYQKLINFWRDINERALAQGLPPRTPEIGVSAASFTLVHEFGHLVESSLLATKRKNVEKVYGVLSEIVLGVKKPKPNQWRYHLINYPSYYYTNVKGKHVGGAERQRNTRRRLRADIRETLGTYATVKRDEIFAEAFAHAYAGNSVKFRSKFKPFVNIMKDLNLATKTLPKHV